MTVATSVNHRHAEVEETLVELSARLSPLNKGNFVALTVLVLHAILDNDGESLTAAAIGLKHLHQLQVRLPTPTFERKEEQGKVLALLEVVMHALDLVLPNLDEEQAAVLTHLWSSGEVGFSQLLKELDVVSDLSSTLEDLGGLGCINPRCFYDDENHFQLSLRGLHALNRYRALQHKLPRTPR